MQLKNKLFFLTTTLITAIVSVFVTYIYLQSKSFFYVQDRALLDLFSYVELIEYLDKNPQPNRLELGKMVEKMIIGEITVAAQADFDPHKLHGISQSTLCRILARYQNNGFTYIDKNEGMYKTGTLFLAKLKHHGAYFRKENGWDNCRKPLDPEFVKEIAEGR